MISLADDVGVAGVSSCSCVSVGSWERWGLESSSVQHLRNILITYSITVFIAFAQAGTGLATVIILGANIVTFITALSLCATVSAQTELSRAVEPISSSLKHWDPSLEGKLLNPFW